MREKRLEKSLQRKIETNSSEKEGEENFIESLTNNLRSYPPQYFLAQFFAERKSINNRTPNPVAYFGW
jgi:hypothetical protein